MCSRDSFFRTNKESSIWRQNHHAKFVGAFHVSKRVSGENRTCSVSIHFFSKLWIPLMEGHLICSHDQFFRTKKNYILENGSFERAFRS